MPLQLPKDYKVALFESKGAPLTFKQVKLELPKAGEVRVPPLPPGSQDELLISSQAGFQIRNGVLTIGVGSFRFWSRC